MASKGRKQENLIFHLNNSSCSKRDENSEDGRDRVWPNFL